MASKKTKSKERSLKSRNPFVIEARGKKAGPLKDRRAKRGGARNKSSELLEEFDSTEFKGG